MLKHNQICLSDPYLLHKRAHLIAHKLASSSLTIKTSVHCFLLSYVMTINERVSEFNWLPSKLTSLFNRLMVQAILKLKNVRKSITLRVC